MTLIDDLNRDLEVPSFDPGIITAAKFRHLVTSVSNLTSNVSSIKTTVEGLPTISTITSNLPSLSAIVAGVPSLSAITSNLPSIVSITAVVQDLLDQVATLQDLATFMTNLAKLVDLLSLLDAEQVEKMANTIQLQNEFMDNPVLFFKDVLEHLQISLLKEGDSGE